MKILAQKIKMQAVFFPDGSIRPVKFKIAEDGEDHLVKIDKVDTVKENKQAGVKSLIFCCQSVIGGVERKYEIKYRVVEHQWELYKM
jgi:hypothetical protein